MSLKNEEKIESKKVTLYLMRHGETIINKAGRVQGWCDGVLTEEGLAVAEKVALGLSDIEFKGVYSSDLGRAIRTAKIIIENNKINNNLKVNEIPELREIYFGKYEGEIEKLMFQNILAHLNMQSLEEGYKTPNFNRMFLDACAALDETGQAENHNKVISRIMKGFTIVSEQVLETGGGNVLIVVHGGMLKNFLKEIDENAQIQSIRNSSISLVEYENGNFNVTSINDMSYKEKGELVKAMSNRI